MLDIVSKIEGDLGAPALLATKTRHVGDTHTDSEAWYRMSYERTANHNDVEETPHGGESASGDDDDDEPDYSHLHEPPAPDPFPQYDPNTLCDQTLRSIRGIEDDDEELFANCAQEYRGPEECPERHDMGYCFGAVETPTDDDDKPILTPENSDRLTPQNIGEARESPFSEELMEALQTEIDTLNKYEVFTDDEQKPAGRGAVDLKVVFKAKWKTGDDGAPVFEKWKARIVCRGFTAVEGQDYDPERISSPVGRASTYFTCLAEAAHKSWHTRYFDIKAAYLPSTLKEKVWVRPPPGLDFEIGEKGARHLRLAKSLYGLKQSGREWYDLFSSLLLEMGFEQSRNDPCLFTLRHRGNTLRIVLYVDDALVTTSSLNMWEHVKTEIHQRTPMSDSGELSNILGMKITHDREARTITISQRLKIEKLLEQFGVHHDTTHPKLTPLPVGHRTNSEGMPTSASEQEEHARSATSPLRPNGFENYYALVHDYRTILGSLGHLAIWGRNDIKHAVYLMARHQAKPSAQDYKNLFHILAYLKGTKDCDLVLGKYRFDVESPLVAMVDSEFAGNHTDPRATTGYVVWAWGSVVHTESRKQGAVTTSTTEAELVAASHATALIKYMWCMLVEDFRCDLPPTPLGEDNMGCIHVSYGGGSWKRKRHIRVADSFIYQEAALAKTIQLQYVKSSENVADMFTKALPQAPFQKFRKALMGHA